MENRIIATVSRRIVTFTLVAGQPFSMELIRWINVIPSATVDLGVRVKSTSGITAAETVRIFATTASQDKLDDPEANYIGPPLMGQVVFPATTSIPSLDVARIRPPYGSALRLFIDGNTASTLPVQVTIEFSVELTGRVSS